MHSLSSADSGSARAVTAERTASIAAGALLMVPVLRQRSSKNWAANWAAAAAGAALIYKGATGTWNITESLVSNAREAAPTSIRQSITIRKDAGQLFSMWRNPDVLTRVMQ